MPGLDIDYGPLLVVGQVGLAAVAFATPERGFRLLLIGWLVSMLISVGSVWGVTLPSMNFWTLIIGHPFAAMVVVAVRCRSQARPPSWFTHVIARMPLRFYIGHLALIHGIALVMELVISLVR